MKKIFISYSHIDSQKVKAFISEIEQPNFDIWIDEKKLISGNRYTTKIINNIHLSDIYMIFLTPASVNSKWVAVELDHAVHDMIETKHLIIIPVLLEDCDIPKTLDNIEFIDARVSIADAATDFLTNFQQKINTNEIIISSIALSCSSITSVEIGPISSDFSSEDLDRDCNTIRDRLNQKLTGVILNLIPIENFDFLSPEINFSNGFYDERIRSISGAFDGGMRKEVSVEATIVHPDYGSIKRLFNKNTAMQGIESVSLGLIFPTALTDKMSVEDIGKKLLCVIQSRYLILSYNFNEGILIEYDKKMYLSFRITKEKFYLKIKARNGYFISDIMPDFDPLKFIEQLINT